MTVFLLADASATVGSFASPAGLPDPQSLYDTAHDLVWSTLVSFLGTAAGVMGFVYLVKRLTHHH